jgi:hypothetical protein
MIIKEIYNLLRLFPFIIILFFIGCEELNIESPTMIEKPEEFCQLNKNKLPPITDIYFVNPEFKAAVFYNNIPTPSGIAVLSTNKLLVTLKHVDADPGIFYARRGDEFSADDAFSTIGEPFWNPHDIIINQHREAIVADGWAGTIFKISRDGGIPEPYVTASITGSPQCDPYGVAIAPRSFDGPNVDPGDLIIADNGHGTEYKAVWAFNPKTGLAKIIAQGSDDFIDGPLTCAFASDGTLFILENRDTGSSRIVILGSDGIVTPFLSEIEADVPLAMVIHPKTDDIFFKKVNGEIHIVPKIGGTPQLFASNIGLYDHLAFNASGTVLYVSVWDRDQIIEISAPGKAWH